MEVLKYDSSALGVYKQSAEDGQTLPEDIPVERSRLVAALLTTSPGNVLERKVCEKRKRQVGLTAKGICWPKTDSKSRAKILEDELTLITDKDTLFTLSTNSRFSARNPTFYKIMLKNKQLLLKKKPFKRAHLVYWKALVWDWCLLEEGVYRRGHFLGIFISREGVYQI